MASCVSNPQGNYVAWERGWTLYNINSYDEDLSTICQLEGSVRTYQWFPGMSNTDANYICEALGGQLPEITSAKEADDYHKIAATAWPNSTECSSKFWTPLTDIDEEGKWVRATKPLEEGDLFWAEGEPDGIFYQNCGLIYPKGMRDVNCPVTFTCAACELQFSAAFSFRGTCETDKRHVYFTSFQSDLGEIEFRGFGGFYISKEGDQWVWRERKGEAVIATMDYFKPNLPPGRRTWNINRTMCDQETGPRVLLFTPCKLNQFTCDDAKCIPLEKRCDLKYDCFDHSDEVDCEIVKFPPGYQFDLPPRPTGVNVSALPITTNITIKSIDVDTMQMNMIVSYEFRMTWFDNRLSYLNLKTQTSLNVLSFSNVEKVWSPAVSFSNTEAGTSTVVDIKSSMFITKNANSTTRDLSAPAESKCYPSCNSYILYIVA